MGGENDHGVFWCGGEAALPVGMRNKLPRRKTEEKEELTKGKDRTAAFANVGPRSTVIA